MIAVSGDDRVGPDSLVSNTRHLSNLLGGASMRPDTRMLCREAIPFEEVLIWFNSEYVECSVFSIVTTTGFRVPVSCLKERGQLASK